MKADCVVFFFVTFVHTTADNKLMEINNKIKSLATFYNWIYELLKRMDCTKENLKLAKTKLL